MEDENPYLRMRAAKIARNKERLESLGLMKKTLTRGASARSAAAAAASSSTTRRNKKHQSPLPSVAVRRSARRAGIAVDYREWSGDTSASSASATRTAAAAPIKATQISGRDTTSAAAEVEIDEDALLAAKKSAASSAIKPSTKNTTCSVGAIVRRWLGKELESTGKAAVIDAAMGASTSVGGVGSISFNKYSGLCEWKNDAIFLWVNINAPNADVKNEFLDGGRRMTWFGGSRMHDGTHGIQNLIRVGRKARNGTLDEADGIILWVRVHDPSRKGFTPYVCLGRVCYDTHAPGTRPIEFVLKLLDYDELKDSQSGNKEMSLFEEIITEA